MHFNFLRMALKLPLHPLLPRQLHVKSRPTMENRLHLLNALPLRFFQKQVNERRHGDVEDRVEGEGVAAPGGDHVRRDEGEEEVEEPLRGDADGGADFADAGGEDLKRGSALSECVVWVEEWWAYFRCIRPR